MKKHSLFILASVVCMMGLGAEYGYCGNCKTAEQCSEGFTCVYGECIADPCVKYSNTPPTEICDDDIRFACMNGKTYDYSYCKNYSGFTSIMNGKHGPRCVKASENRVKCGCNTDDDCGLNFLCQPNHECKKYSVSVLSPKKDLEVNCENIKGEPSNKHITSCASINGFELTDEDGTKYTLKTSSSNRGFFDLISSGDYIQFSNLRPGANLYIIWGLEGDELSNEALENNYIVVSNGEETREFKVNGSGTRQAVFPNGSAKSITIKRGGSGNVKIGIKNLNYFYSTY